MDPNGCWYLADSAMGPGDLLLLTGRTLEKATAGVRKAGVFRIVSVASTATASLYGRYVSQIHVFLNIMSWNFFNCIGINCINYYQEYDEKVHCLVDY